MKENKKTIKAAPGCSGAVFVKEENSGGTRMTYLLSVLYCIHQKKKKAAWKNAE